MKKIFAFTLVALLFACSGNKEKSEMDQVELGEAYGPVAVDVTKAISIKEFFTDFEQQDSTGTYTIEGKIIEICGNAGCWVGIDKENGDGDYFMVRFKDHFTIPIDTELGKGAFIHGVAKWDSITVKQLQTDSHAAGKTQAEIDAITQPEYSFDFIADGIVLKK